MHSCHRSPTWSHEHQPQAVHKALVTLDGALRAMGQASDLASMPKAPASILPGKSTGCGGLRPSDRPRT